MAREKSVISIWSLAGDMINPTGYREFKELISEELFERDYTIYD